MNKNKCRLFRIAVFTMIILMLSSSFITAYSISEETFEEASVSCYTNNETTVYLGGHPFGVRFYTEGITVVGFSDVETESEDKSPAFNAGLREYDVIISVNSKAISSAKDFTDITESSEGNPIAVDYKRMGKIYSTSFSPVLCTSDGKYKTGMWIKDSTAGIGTLTYIMPETNAFAGLGHSICDSNTGDILKMTKGIVLNVTIDGVEKSSPGKPGELKGVFSGEKTGSLTLNCEEGIFGILNQLPDSFSDDTVISIAKSQDITEGEATIRCTIDSDGPKDYAVNLTSIDFDEATNKNYVIEIVDERLIEKTGGIVQGMSGSPIIQNEKLIGAVTHVFISDPLKGYGISIDNMLNSMPEILK